MNHSHHFDSSETIRFHSVLLAAMFSLGFLACDHSDQVGNPSGSGGNKAGGTTKGQGGGSGGQASGGSSGDSASGGMISGGAPSLKSDAGLGGQGAGGAGGIAGASGGVSGGTGGSVTSQGGAVSSDAGVDGTMSTGGITKTDGATSLDGAAMGGAGGSGGAINPTGPLPKITIYMIGDSTMADKAIPNSENERGWGQMMPQFFKAEAKISNHAKNGRSSKSFIDEGLWKAVITNLKAGDWLIAQFGHNDEKDEKERHTDPFTTYAENLKKFATETRAKGGFPIICTPIVRGGDLEGHGDYPEGAIAAAKAVDAPLIDLEKETKIFVGALGNSRLKEFYINRDNTHLVIAGGTKVAEMATKAIREMNLPLAAYLK
jgi:lysophospholipase L1-like esterase